VRFSEEREKNGGFTEWRKGEEDLLESHEPSYLLR